MDIKRNHSEKLTKKKRPVCLALNALGKIFDKTTVQEQQELASMFGEVAFNAIGDLGLKEDSPEKVALKGIVGGIMSQMAGGSFASGATSAGFTQYITNELSKIKDPALLQWASFIIGASVSKLTGGNGLTGGSITLNDIRNNWLASGHNTLMKILQSDEMEQILKKANYQLSDKDIQDLQTASAKADSDQAASLSLHAMPETTKFEIEGKFSENMTYAINLEAQGDHQGAMYYLGFALHTTQDYYSHFSRGALGDWASHIIINPLTGMPIPDDPTFQPIRFEQAGQATMMATQIFVDGIKTGKIDQDLKFKIFNPRN